MFVCFSLSGFQQPAGHDTAQFQGGTERECIIRKYSAHAFATFILKKSQKNVHQVDFFFL